MSMHSLAMRQLIPGAAILAFAAGALAAETPNLGKAITPAETAAWDITVRPDGAGLPSGSGTAAQGAVIYAQKCAACHGENGRGGGPSALLIGGPPRASLDGGKTIPNFWPYATTLFDF